MRNQKLPRDFLLVAAATVLVLSAVSPDVWAMAKPTDANALGHFVYETVVTKILNGPIGFVCGLGIVAYSVLQITKNWTLSLMGIIGGSCLINAEKIVVALGALL